MTTNIKPVESVSQESISFSHEFKNVPDLSQSPFPEVSADDPIRIRIREAARTVRETTPMAQSFTNFVTMNFVANAQLAAGGAAAMSFLPDEVKALSEVGGANYINVGTLLPFYKNALEEIVSYFYEHGKHWVLDPVAAGIGEDRTAILKNFKDYPPSIIRGNASEIITMAKLWELDVDGSSTDSQGPKGVESVDDVESAVASAIALAKHMASKNHSQTAAVAVSGEVDLVTDGETVYRLPGGSELMTKITGAGCSLGGVVACYLAVADPLTAALGASMLYNRASEQAEVAAEGPGSFQSCFLDSLRQLNPEDIASSPLCRAAM